MVIVTERRGKSAERFQASCREDNKLRVSAVSTGGQKGARSAADNKILKCWPTNHKINLYDNKLKILRNFNVKISYLFLSYDIEILIVLAY